ncbi:immunoglobulin superfamily containing leucine-rich repeat protein 2-like [Antennarius striatus]|uniref:immunoglobulin superfamily containing leucine-rich repeat protein 2-like n=1 Tax=Antennarius striatus TaxID=241820 RepID=UPI0035B13FFB
MDLVHSALWLVAVVAVGLGCPERCICLDKYGRHAAECSYKALTALPEGFPPNVSTISLSANDIRSISRGGFDRVHRLTSLWLSHNQIVSIEGGALAPLARLRNLDVSNNRIVDFPWGDLQNLTALRLLKMDHNRMEHLPADAFRSLKDLRSLRLNHNRFRTVSEGTFDGLVSMSYLQIYQNPFACSCLLDWLRLWISTTPVSIPEPDLIQCESPEELRGAIIAKLPESKCTSANVTIRTSSTTVRVGGALVLTCESIGNPEPLVVWSIRSKRQRRDLVLSSNEVAVPSPDWIMVFNNGTLVISPIREEDGGDYSCWATNELGQAEDSVSVKVVAANVQTVNPTSSTRGHRTSPPTDQLSVESRRWKFLDVKSTSESPVGATHPSNTSKCRLTANTRYVSGHASNGSLDEVKQHTFDFGVIALGVSDTEATVRLNPLLMPRNPNQDSTAPEDPDPDIRDHRGPSNGLYLCIAADRKHLAVQWARIQEGVNTYLFGSLHPGTNYSLCLNYRGEDCEVQVVFTTRRRVPNLVIIVSVSICLLVVSTVPLLGATCFHLVYKYRSKTYQLILKARDQYQLERNLTATYHRERNLTAAFIAHAPHRESFRKTSRLEDQDVETDSGDGAQEADTEDSILTESFSLSQGRGGGDHGEAGSEYSDRLPLGAEAINIVSDYGGPNP